MEDSFRPLIELLICDDASGASLSKVGSDPERLIGSSLTKKMREQYKLDAQASEYGADESLGSAPCLYLQ